MTRNSHTFFTAANENNDDLKSEIFRYNRFYSTTGNAAQKHPIYVVLKNHCIQFIFQGKIKTTVNDPDYIFTSSTILSVPLDQQDLGDPETEVRRIFNRSLSIKPYADQYILEIRESHFAYSSLAVFGLANKNISYVWQNDGDDDLKETFLRRLFLDFLDDFFNFQTFSRSKKYLTIKHKILTCDTLNGIYLKADFYNKGNKLKIASPTDRLQRDVYFDALKNWVSYITNPGYEKIFAKDKKQAKPEAWFDFADKELTRPLFEKIFLLNDSIIKTSIVKTAVDNLVENYEIIKAAAVIVLNYRFFFAIVFVLAIGLSVSIFQNFPTNNFSMSRTVMWKLIFLFSGFCLWPFIAYNIIQRLQLNAKNYIEYEKALKNNFTLRQKLTVWQYRIWLKIVSFFNVLLVSIGIIYWTWWLFYNKGFAQLCKSNWGWLMLLLYVFLAIGTVFFISSLIAVRTAINVLLPRLQMALITSWIGILASYEIWKNGYSMGLKESIIYSLLLLFVTSCYLLFEVRRNTNLINKTRIYWKLLNVMIPGFLLSLSIGMIGINLVGQKHMTNTDFVNSKLNRKKIFEIAESDRLVDEFLVNKRQLDIYLDKLNELKTHKNIRLASTKTDAAKFQLEIDSLKAIILANDRLLKEMLPATNYHTKISDPDSLYQLFIEKKYSFITLDRDFAASPIKLVHHTKNLYKSRQLVVYNFKIGDLNIIIIPSFLILMGSMALFSSIFLTLLFDDKPVTDTI